HPAVICPHEGDHQGGGHHGTHHDHIAMGEIDQADDAVHHGVAQRHQGVDTADRDAIDQLLEQNVHEPFTCSHSAGGRCSEAAANAPLRLHLAWLNMVLTISHLPPSTL